MIASQVNGGMIDIHTCPRYVVMVTVAAMPSLPLVETLRGIPKASGTLAAFTDERWMHPARVETEARRPFAARGSQLRLALSRRRVRVSTQAKGWGIEQSENVDTSWHRCGNRAIDLRESP